MPETEDKGAKGDLATDLRAILADLRKGEGTDRLNARLLDKIEEREAENRKYRNQIRSLREGTRKVNDGDVVLTGDDAKAWERYKALGDPKDIRKLLDDGKAAVAERDQLAHTQVRRRAAELLGYRPGLFERLARADNLNIAIEAKAHEGKEIFTPYVMGEGGTKTPLADYVLREWPDDLPVLRAGDRGDPAPERMSLADRRAGRIPPPTGGNEEFTSEERQLINTGRYGPA